MMAAGDIWVKGTAWELGALPTCASPVVVLFLGHIYNLIHAREYSLP